MSLEIQLYSVNEVRFDRKWLELILLDIADAYNIQVAWDSDVALMSALLAVAGGLKGARARAAFGAGFGCVAGTGRAQVKPLTEIWSEVKGKLKELLYIVFNYLRKLDADDYIRAYKILVACVRIRQELVKIIIAFITEKLGREVFSSLNAA